MTKYYLFTEEARVTAPGGSRVLVYRPGWVRSVPGEISAEHAARAVAAGKAVEVGIDALHGAAPAAPNAETEDRPDDDTDAD